MQSSGDSLRLSSIDQELIELAVTLQDEYEPIVVTDDYSMQNLIRIIGLKHLSVLTKGIEELYSWILKCQGCKKRYPVDHQEAECDICGSSLVRRRKKNQK